LFHVIFNRKAAFVEPATPLPGTNLCNSGTDSLAD